MIYYMNILILKNKTRMPDVYINRSATVSDLQRAILLAHSRSVTKLLTYVCKNWRCILKYRKILKHRTQTFLENLQFDFATLSFSLFLFLRLNKKQPDYQNGILSNSFKREGNEVCCIVIKKIADSFIFIGERYRQQSHDDWQTIFSSKRRIFSRRWNVKNIKFRIIF